LRGRRGHGDVQRDRLGCGGIPQWPATATVFWLPAANGVDPTSRESKTRQVSRVEGELRLEARPPGTVGMATIAGFPAQNRSRKTLFTEPRCQFAVSVTSAGGGRRSRR